MSRHKIEFTRRARAQIRNLFSYIAQDSPAAAQKTLDSIDARIQRLADAPELGVELSEAEYPFLEPGYRKLLARPFLVYYRIAAGTVYITHVVHERQNQRSALKS
ncbi:MAG: type II toxin-antitoxin system RelE/ParE family toxin [Clostridia bacterium]|nr:type II toxin-antitoxin system RelE/ParE family toxin [Clostridia bacterium]